MPDFQPRGRELTLPKPWPGLGLHRSNDEIFGCIYPGEGAGDPPNWYFDCGIKYNPLALNFAEDQSAVEGLAAMLRDQAGDYWPRVALERSISQQFKISTNAVRQIMRGLPGAATVEAGGVFCASASVAAWPKFKQSVYATVPADTLATLHEIAVAVARDPGSVAAALMVLTAQRSIACIQEQPDQGPFYCRSRPGMDRASYADLYARRVPVAP